MLFGGWKERWRDFHTTRGVRGLAKWSTKDLEGNTEGQGREMVPRTGQNFSLFFFSCSFFVWTHVFMHKGIASFVL